MQQHSTQPINENVGKIALECEEAGASKWDVVKIIKSLSEKEVLGIEELRKEAISALQGINPEAAAVYASFHRMHVHTSKEKIEGFDRGNIIKSLLKETSLPRTIAERIGHEVEGKIKDLKISYLDTALIRELVNARLLEYGYENIYRQYARLGLPVYDIAEKVSRGFYENYDLLKEYSLQKLIPIEIREQHFSAEIHISALGEFPTKAHAYCLEVDGSGKFAGAENFALGLLERISTLQKFVSLPLSVSALNMAIAKHLDGMKANQMPGVAIAICKALKLSKLRHAIGINLYAPDDFQINAHEKQQAVLFANVLLSECAKYPEQIAVKIAIDSPAQLNLLKPHLQLSGVHFLNCRSNNLRPLANGFYSRFGNGILSCTAVNLAKIALSARGDDGKFFELLEKCINSAKKIAEIKLQQLGLRKYMKENALDLGSLNPALCLDSLFCAASEFVSGDVKNLGINANASKFRRQGSLDEKEINKFAERIVDSIRKSIGAEWIIAPIADDEARERFAYENSAKFGYAYPKINSAEMFMKSGFLVKRYYSAPCTARSMQEVGSLLAGNAECIAME